jgi:feruloyl esterase
MGAESASGFMSLYFIPAVYHCAGGPIAATLDMLTPLMNWVEDGAGTGAPGRGLSHRWRCELADHRTRAVFPYPEHLALRRQGRRQEGCFVRAGSADARASATCCIGRGLFHYTPSEQLRCKVKDKDASMSLRCTPERERDR